MCVLSNPNSHTSGSSHRKAIPIATNKASGLTARNTNNIRQASVLFAGAEGNKYDAWFLLYDDWQASGVKGAQPYAAALAKNPNITTKVPAKQTEEVLGAIRRCVRKYGSVKAVKAAHAKWVKANGYEYADVSNLKAFAPDGQRASNTGNTGKSAVPASAVTLTRSEANKRLAVFPKGMRDEIIKALGIK